MAHRVEALADREAGAAVPATAGKVASLVPLPEILSEIVGSGVASKAVTHTYDRAIAALGPELAVLEEMPVEDVARVDPLLGEAVTRLRSGEVIRQAGYDGEYGVVRLFQDGELDRLAGNQLLFDAPLFSRVRRAKPAAKDKASDDAPVSPEAVPAMQPSGRGGVLAGLDADQAHAAEVVDGALMVIAGPGAGKTRMLTHRIAHLVLECGVPAGSCLAVTFTRKATEELRTRLTALLGRKADAVAVHSFHSLGLAILHAHAGRAGLGADFRIAGEAERKAALAEVLGVSDTRAARHIKAVSVLKRGGGKGADEEVEARAVLDRIGRAQGWVDFDDLILLSADLLDKGLEFPVVFVVGMEAGLMPFSWGAATPDEEAQDEERRLFYVSMTRAIDRLFLTRAKERFWRGAVRALPASPFLGRIAADLTVSELASGRKSRRAQQLDLF